MWIKENYVMSMKIITYFTLSQIHVVILFRCRFCASDIIHWLLYYLSVSEQLFLIQILLPLLYVSFTSFFIFPPLFFPAISFFWELLVSFRKHFCLFKKYQFGSNTASCFSFPFLPILFVFKGMEFCSNLIFSMHIFN